jgi:hypothetical protein
VFTWFVARRGLAVVWCGVGCVRSLASFGGEFYGSEGWARMKEQIL